ncbi:2-hydroxychromene-2-carboxylate isomerase [Lysobacter gummosus]|uniref:2-hydroxychromene-2-carboxylate isomerase n=1 Tax=Lysobacter gummosus TaxID=262324 RepID=A0ABY3XG70_9GAMM|nr:2-hydroxychromene-2-carboxylate isomerase [Lysobacter gummosus]ALN90076.1 DSBA-like thioredoxin domain protein [Lysobacter gummosus]UNP30644.1 2-hydroxychromene-2-carboxylate isomerase [Lysobacter gummosus]
MTVIDYYLSLISPYAYLGHAPVLALARETGARLAYKPVRIFELFSANGGLPLGQRAPARQRYRLVELQRARAQREVPLNLAPKFFPVDPSLADRCLIALCEAGRDPSSYMDAAFRAIWAHDQDLADRDVLARLLRDHGHDVEATFAAAQSEAVGAIYEANTAAAIAADLPGLPGYVLRGEPFWGQDRVEALREALLSGREPFLIDAGR